MAAQIKDENYYQIQGWMINRLKLKGTALIVYAIIYGFSQDGENEYTGSLQYLCAFLGGVSKPTVIKALQELTKQGYIIRREETVNKVMFTRYKVNLTLLKNFNGGSKEILPAVVKNLNGGSKESLPNNKDYNKSTNNSYIKDIVEFLNEQAGTNYRSATKGTQTLINARLNEGFTVNDFKTVIVKKCAEWKNDPKMAKYIRPETLFGNKFENYLNAPTVAKSGAKEDHSLDDVF